MKRIIVAYDQKRGIGASNDIMWLPDLPADMRHFREVTMGSTLIMGRKTYESIGRPLPGRETIVISRSAESIPDVVVVDTLDSAYNAVTTEDVYIAGGGEIYKLALSTVDEVVATEIHATFPQAEVFFPELTDDVWSEVSRISHDVDVKNKYPYDFVVYERFKLSK
jgi:dihydrofolate reductase